MTTRKPTVEVLDPLDTTIAEIERLVMNVAHKAVQDATPLDQKVDALKACQPYYAALIKGKNRESNDTESSFADFAGAIRNAESEHGGAQVRGRNGRAGDA